MATSPRTQDELDRHGTPESSSDLLVQEMKADFNSRININTTAAGLAIVVGNTGPAGVEVDIDNMKKAFMNLNFVVIVHENPTAEYLVALLHVAANYQYPKGFFRFIALYFAGHGGSRNGHPFIYPTKNDRSAQLNVEEEILSKFYPENALSLGNRTRLFFFDSCLKDDQVKGPDENSAQFEECKDAMLPARGNILVAYATSLTFGSRGNKDKGGYWTRHLHHNLVNLDLSLSTVLDITWEETVNDTGKKYKADLYKTQGPHYISCLGLLYLRHPNWDRDQALEHSKRGTGATNNIQDSNTLEHSQEAFVSTSNGQDTKASKDYQRTTTASNGGQEMRALECSGEVSADTNDGGQDSLRYYDPGNVQSSDEEDELEAKFTLKPKKGARYATRTDQPGGRCDPLLKLSARASLWLCKKPCPAEAACRIARARASGKWKLIGNVLGLDQCFLDQVSTRRLEPRDCLDCILEKWVEKRESTWRCIYLALAMHNDEKLQCAAKNLAEYMESEQV